MGCVVLLMESHGTLIAPRDASPYAPLTSTSNTHTRSLCIIHRPLFITQSFVCRCRHGVLTDGTKYLEACPHHHTLLRMLAVPSDKTAHLHTTGTSRSLTMRRTIWTCAKMPVDMTTFAHQIQVSSAREARRPSLRLTQDPRCPVLAAEPLSSKPRSATSTTARSPNRSRPTATTVRCDRCAGPVQRPPYQQ